MGGEMRLSVPLSAILVLSGLVLVAAPDGDEPPLQSSLQSIVQTDFQTADQDHSGFVTEAEIKLGSAKLTPGEVPTDDEVKEVMNMYDTNKDGKISMAEYTADRDPQKYAEAEERLTRDITF